MVIVNVNLSRNYAQHAQRTPAAPLPFYLRQHSFVFGRATCSEHTLFRRRRHQISIINSARGCDLNRPPLLVDTGERTSEQYGMLAPPRHPRSNQYTTLYNVTWHEQR